MHSLAMRVHVFAYVGKQCEAGKSDRRRDSLSLLSLSLSR